MPNGGVPIHMVLYLKNNPEIVVYSFGGNLLVFNRNDWETLPHSDLKPMIEISKDETKMLAWFIDYWVGNTEHYEGTYEHDGVNVTYDY